MPQTSSARTWRHRSVLALMDGVKTTDPTEVIRRKARDIVKNARAQGWSGPPFDPLILASLLGIKCRSSDKLFSAEAQLSPQPGRQLLLEFNPDRPDGRRNYSVCHEITHTLFDDCYERVHHRTTKRTRFHPDDEVEQLCQIGASELLMPMAEFKKDLSEMQLSLASVAPLRERYSASREAVLRRMVYFSKRPCAAVFFSRRNSPKEKEALENGGSVPDPKMRIIYAVCSSDFPIYLPRHKSVSDSSCVSFASRIDVVQSGREYWEIQGFGDWNVEAFRLATPDEADDTIPAVAALVLADSWLS